MEIKTQHISQPLCHCRVESRSGVLERCAVDLNIEMSVLTLTKTNGCNNAISKQYTNNTYLLCGPGVKLYQT